MKTQALSVEQHRMEKKLSTVFLLPASPLFCSREVFAFGDLWQLVYHLGYLARIFSYSGEVVPCFLW